MSQYISLYQYIVAALNPMVTTLQEAMKMAAGGSGGKQLEFKITVGNRPISTFLNTFPCIGPFFRVTRFCIIKGKLQAAGTNKHIAKHLETNHYSTSYIAVYVHPINNSI